MTRNDQYERLTMLICYLSVIVIFLLLKSERKNPVLQGWDKSERRTREGLVPLAVRQNFGTMESISAKTLKTTMRAKPVTKITLAWTKPSWVDMGCHAG